MVVLSTKYHCFILSLNIFYLSCFSFLLPVLCTCCLLVEEEEDSDDEGHAVHQKACSVVWEGKVLDRAFSDWKVFLISIINYNPTQCCNYSVQVCFGR